MYYISKIPFNYANHWYIFNQIVCFRHRSTNEGFGAHTFVCDNTNCDPMIPINRNRAPESISAQPEIVNSFWLNAHEARKRLNKIKMHALFSLNGNECTANCLICAIKTNGMESRATIHLCSVEFFVQRAFVVYARKLPINACDNLKKKNHIPHILATLFGTNRYTVAHFKTKGKCSNWLHFCNNRISSNSIWTKIMKESKREKEEWIES